MNAAEQADALDVLLLRAQRCFAAARQLDDEQLRREAANVLAAVRWLRCLVLPEQRQG